MDERLLAEMARKRDNMLRRERARRYAIARANGLPYGWVDATPIREHLNALAALNWGWPAIAMMHGGVTDTQLSQIAMGGTTQATRRMLGLLDIPLSYAVPDVLPDSCEVPVIGARRRVQGLIALGWTHQTMAPYVEGFSTARLMRGSNRPAYRMSARNWRRVDRAFQQLAATPGPSKRARTQAITRFGYVPPAAWDDIDSPYERPKGVSAA